MTHLQDSSVSSSENSRLLKIESICENIPVLFEKEIGDPDPNISNLTGRRFVNISHIIQSSRALEGHKCTIKSKGFLTFKREVRKGFRSSLVFECQSCKESRVINTDPGKTLHWPTSCQTMNKDQLQISASSCKQPEEITEEESKTESNNLLQRIEESLQDSELGLLESETEDCKYFGRSSDEFLKSNCDKLEDYINSKNEEFVRRIEESLLDSKDNLKRDWKQEYDSSLPFKKRLKTMFTCKPKPVSFLSYPSTPMISIAEMLPNLNPYPPVLDIPPPEGNQGLLS